MAPNYFTLMQNQLSHDAQTNEEMKRNNQEEPNFEFVATYKEINQDDDLESP